MKRIFTLLLVVVLFGIYSCKKTEKDEQNQTQDSITHLTQNEVKTFYLVPSPDDVFGFAEDKSLKFEPSLLNPVENLRKYNTVKLQEFNFGIYAADLAYCAASNKNDETVKYLNAVRELSQKIGLADVFNESLVYRIEHLTPQKDSLIALSNDTYFDIIRFLERSDRPTTLALMAAGGWLECMYLVVNQLDYEDGNPTLQKVADQKLILTNLMKFLEQHNDNPDVKDVINEFQPLYDIYQNLKTETIENEVNAKPSDPSVIIVGGNTRFVITADQYAQLKKTVNDIRNKLTLNNVSQ